MARSPRRTDSRSGWRGSALSIVRMHQARVVECLTMLKLWNSTTLDFSSCMGGGSTFHVLFGISSYVYAKVDWWYLPLNTAAGLEKDKFIIYIPSTQHQMILSKVSCGHDHTQPILEKRYELTWSPQKNGRWVSETVRTNLNILSGCFTIYPCNINCHWELANTSSFAG